MADTGICILCYADTHTYLCVVGGPGFVSTSSAFMKSSAIHPSGPHGRLAPKTVNLDDISTQFVRQFVPPCSSTACRLCRLETDIHHFA